MQSRLKGEGKLALKVRALRLSRRWTQAELAARLELSQSRLSEIERGDGSFTAEQFLEILRLFNVATDYFTGAAVNDEAAQQNVLARVGASHLRERRDVLPSDGYQDVNRVMLEVLISASSARLVAALAPVLVANINDIKLAQLQVDLTDAGLGQRLGWLVENTLQAIREAMPGASKSQRSLYRRADIVLSGFLARTREERGGAKKPPIDVLDSRPQSAKTRAELMEALSPISRHWGVVTNIQLKDFVEALRAAHASG